MVARGLAPDFTPEALVELAAIKAPAAPVDAATRDLRSLLWCSIDNDDSRDLDQLSVAEAGTEGLARNQGRHRRRFRRRAAGLGPR